MKSTKRTKSLRERRAEIGLTRHEHYYHKKHHGTVVDFVRRLNKTPKLVSPVKKKLYSDKVLSEGVAWLDSL